MLMTFWLYLLFLVVLDIKIDNFYSTWMLEDLMILYIFYKGRIARPSGAEDHTGVDRGVHGV